MTESLRNYFRTKHVPIAISSTVGGTTRIYQTLDEIVAEVEDARVWGGLHFRTTMTQSARHFTQIARNIGRQHFLTRANGHDDEDDDRHDNDRDDDDDGDRDGHGYQGRGGRHGP